MATNIHGQVQQQHAIVHIDVGQKDRLLQSGLFGFRPPAPVDEAYPVSEVHAQLLIAKACLDAYGELAPQWQDRPHTVTHGVQFESEESAKKFADCWDEDLEKSSIRCERNGRDVMLHWNGKLDEVFILKTLLLTHCCATAFDGQLAVWAIEEPGQYWMAVTELDTRAARTTH